MTNLRLVGDEVVEDDWGGEHPIEVARRALRRAAELEYPLLADALRLSAQSLPERSPTLRREHPTEKARRALLAAAEVETGGWPVLLRQFASAMPERDEKGGG